MGMNIMKMMQQVQNIQKKAGAMQEELANLEIEGQSAGGAVKITVDGRGRYKSIKISQEAITSADQDSIEMLEDLISAAMNDASSKADKEMESRMAQITGGLKIPGLDLFKK